MIRHPKLEIERLRLSVGGRVLELKAPATLEAGKLYLLLGPSGLGKTSLARALLGLAEASTGVDASGIVTIRDQYDENMQVPVLRGNEFLTASQQWMAWMPQLGAQGFIDELSVQDNATIYSSLAPQDVRPELEKLAARLRIWPLPRQMARASGGEKMRVGAVRALLPRSKDIPSPALLIADEPTVGLDPKAARQVIDALTEVARESRTILLVITHDPSHFVDAAKLEECGDKELQLVACSTETPRSRAECSEVEGRGEDDGMEERLAEREPLRELGNSDSTQALTPLGEAGKLVVAGVHEETRAEHYKRTTLNAVDAMGRLLLSPAALVWGLVKMPRRLLLPVVKDIARTTFNPGTLIFVIAACVMVSATISIFTFELMPKREIVEPLLLPDVLNGVGIALQLVLLPLFAAVFATAKNGAAQAARLSSSVRGGLLDTLALGRIRPESYALVPSVIGQTLSLALTTFLGSALGLFAGALVFISGNTEMSIDQVLDFIWAGVEIPRYSGWFGWVVWKVVLSGVAGGVIASLFGLMPASSERDVGKAVRRTLLWTMIVVLLIQCTLIVLEHGG